MRLEQTLMPYIALVIARPPFESIHAAVPDRTDLRNTGRAMLALIAPDIVTGAMNECVTSGHKAAAEISSSQPANISGSGWVRKR